MRRFESTDQQFSPDRSLATRWRGGEGQLVVAEGVVFGLSFKAA